MNDNKPTIFYFDRIRVNFYIDQDAVRSYFRPHQLRQILYREQSNISPLREAQRKIRKHGFKSTLDITAATPKALDILRDIEPRIRKDHPINPYKISYIEIARDELCDTPEEAVERAAKLEGIKLRWMDRKDNNKYRFDPYAFNPTNAKKRRDGLFINSSTHYCGGPFMELCGYSRVSKACEWKRPCAHAEFKLKRAGNIRSKAGIETLTDLTTEKAEEVFNRLWSKYTYRSDLDPLRLGKWLLGIEGLKRLSPEKRREALRQAKLHCTLYKISNYKDLSIHIREKQLQIRSHYKGQRGRKSDRDQRWLNIRPTRFKAP